MGAAFQSPAGQAVQADAPKFLDKQVPDGDGPRRGDHRISSATGPLLRWAPSSAGRSDGPATRPEKVDRMSLTSLISSALGLSRGINASGRGPKGGRPGAKALSTHLHFVT
jgi:hypothetical protein